MNPSDRKAIGSLHYHGSGLGESSTSVSSRKRPTEDHGPWQKVATPIASPQNGPPRQVGNPYDPRGRGTTARQTVTNIDAPRKRQKLYPSESTMTSKHFRDSSGMSNLTNDSFSTTMHQNTKSGWGSGLSNTSYMRGNTCHPQRRTLRAGEHALTPTNPSSSNTLVQPITIDDDEEEDAGEVVPRLQFHSHSIGGDGPKDMNLDCVPTVAAELNIDVNDVGHARKEQEWWPPSAPDDGHATQRLRRRHKAREGEPSHIVIEDVDTIDPIEDAEGFDSSNSSGRAFTPGGQTRFPPNNVSQKRKLFGGKDNPGVLNHVEVKKMPQIVDLRTFRKKIGLVSGMKPKNGAQRPYHNPFQQTAEKSLLPDISTVKPDKQRRHDTSSASTSTPLDNFIALPLDAWALGNHIFDSGMEDVWLLWAYGNSKALIIQKGSPVPGQGSKLCAITLGEKLRSFKYPATMDQPTIQIQLRLASAKVSFSPGLEPVETSDMVTFCFQKKHPNVQQHFSQLTSSLRLVSEEKETMTAHGALAVWNMITSTRLAESLPPLDTGEIAFSGSSKLEPPKPDLEGLVAESVKPVVRVRPRPIVKGGNHATPITMQRLTRQTATTSTSKTPPPNHDEIILVYPPSGSGAVNVCNSDLRRLEPGEYLNDTLIELGLKFWMHDLRKHSPEVAEQTHIFSSFFYKKLNSKNVEEGYQSLIKWTSKIDLFKKKYIIVPINEHLHWYLAIIYHPEHVLEPPPPKPVKNMATRAKARGADESTQPAPKAERSAPSSTDTQTTLAISVDGDTGTAGASHSGTIRESSQEAVERVIQSAGSCSIEDKDEEIMVLGGVEGGGPPPSSQEVPDSETEGHAWESGSSRGGASDESDGEDELMDDDICADDSLNIVLGDLGGCAPASGGRSTARTGSPMDIDPPRARTPAMSSSPLSPAPSDATSDFERIPDADALEGLPSSGIPPERFYQSRLKTAQKRRATRSPAPARADENDHDELAPLSDVPSPSKSRVESYIFTLDSLGSAHPQAIRKLRMYLELEAKHKKQMSETTVPMAKTAPVPTQPNYCDCGLYLLHFAQMFMENPEGMAKSILGMKGTAPAEVRQRVWHGERVADMRRALLARIGAESEVWRKEKAAREEREREKERDGGGAAVAAATAAGGDSDGEIIVGEIVTRAAAAAAAAAAAPAKVGGGGGAAARKGKAVAETRPQRVR